MQFVAVEVAPARGEPRCREPAAAVPDRARADGHLVSLARLTEPAGLSGADGIMSP